jgi:lipoate-protein ligase A
MRFLDLTLDTPTENLACDEALLDLCEEAGVEVLRFWESRQHFVVVGYGNRIESEVNAEECKRRGVAILRRCSGGGTVVQGPGCLNYNLTLRIPESGPLTTVTGTNEFVLERNRGALEQVLGVEVSVQGHTDLAFVDPPLTLNPPSASSAKSRSKITRKSKKENRAQHWLKFSGNAQRRRRHSLVFHGTILYAFDLSLVNALLPLPSNQPEYRAGRSHAEFVRNVTAAPDTIRVGLREAWSAGSALAELPTERLQYLLREHYLNDAWVFRTGR